MSRFFLITLLSFSSFIVEAINVDVSVSNSTATPGDDIYYRIVISNTDGITRSNVELRVVSPGEATFIDPLPLETSGCVGSCDSLETSLWQLGDMVDGDSKVIIIPLNTSSSASDATSYSLIASVTYTGIGSAVTDTGNSSIDSSPSADLHLMAKKQLVSANEIVEYEISYGNIGSTGITTPQISVSIPSGTTFISASDNGSLVGSNIIWNLSSALNVGEADKRFFKVQVDASASNGTIYDLQAEVNNGAGALRTSQESIVVRNNVDLSLTATVLGDISQPNKNTFYRYVVANNGAVDIAGVTLNNLTAERTTHIDALPLETSGCVGACDSTEWALWNLGTIRAGESKVITVPVVRSTPIDGEALESHVIVTDSSGAYTLGMRPTVIAKNVTSPQIVVSSDRSLSKSGAIQNFTVSVGNPTGSTLSNGLVVIEIPSGYSFVSASGNNEVKDGKIFWPIGSLAANQWLDETIALQIDVGLVDGSVLFLEARLEDDSQLSLLALASLATTINSQSSMILRTSTSYTSPVTEGDVVNLRIDATNESGVQIAGVSIYSMTPSNTTASNSGVTSGCVESCNSAEWAYWDLGAIDASNLETRTFVQTLSSGNEAPESGSLLLSNTYLTHISSPILDQTIVNAMGVGIQFTVDPNHDSDSDGIPDWWEIRWGYSRLDSSDASTDDDVDGSNNLEEYQESTDPTNQDTDGDGILDGPDSDPLNDNPPIANAGADTSARELLT